jgi:hypothetical protein
VAAVVCRYEKRHKNVSAHLSPAFRCKEGDHVVIGQCRWAAGWVLAAPSQLKTTPPLYPLHAACAKIAAASGQHPSHCANDSGVVVICRCQWLAVTFQLPGVEAVQAWPAIVSANPSQCSAHPCTVLIIIRAVRAAMQELSVPLSGCTPCFSPL